ncbi:MAG: ArdC family protein [Micropruina sp.]|uniref:ArdC family protein n=1 Tax=Micropruina sp. TaxID=2737536 RepID=UPI0039E471DD
MTGHSLSEAQREAADRARRETVEELHRQLTEHVGSLDNRAEWERYLAFARSFHQYSFGNRLLIMLQAPDATAVAGYRAWQARGYQVRRGEKAIRVLGPVTKRAPILDPAGNPVLDADGKPRETRQLVGVKPVPVFDISQTDGPPPPQHPDPVLLTGQAPPGLWDALATLVADRGFRLERGDCQGANGLTLYSERVVRVRADVDDAQAVKSLAHEVGHVLMHPDGADRGCRGLEEVEAESVAYMVTQAHGLDSGQYTFRYITGWATQAAADPEQVVRATGQRVIEAADLILAHTQPDAIRPAEDALDAFEANIDRTITTGWESTSTTAISGVTHDRKRHLRALDRGLVVGR